MKASHDVSVAHALSDVASWARQAVFMRAAQVFIETCEASGIAVLPVKGIVTGRLFYDDPAQRPLTDVDVRVVPRDVPRIASLCGRHGWAIRHRMRTYSNLVVDVGGVAVDVEAHVGPPGLCNLRIAEMLSRATWCDVGFPCRIPDPTDHGVLLMVNAFKDKLFGALEWAIRDLEQLATRDNFDANALVERLRECGAVTLGWITADWLVQHRHAAAWVAVRDALKPNRPAYVSALKAAMAHDPHALVTRILARNAADARMSRVRAIINMTLWRAEVVLSKFGSTPFARGRMVPAARAKIRS